jgi:hypothetical protein
MVHLRTRYHNFGTFCKASEWKTLESFRGIRFLPMYVVRPFGIVCGHLVYFFPVLVHCAEKNLATPELRWCLLNFPCEKHYHCASYEGAYICTYIYYVTWMLKYWQNTEWLSTFVCTYLCVGMYYVQLRGWTYVHMLPTVFLTFWIGFSITILGPKKNSCLIAVWL